MTDTIPNVSNDISTIPSFEQWKEKLDVEYVYSGRYKEVGQYSYNNQWVMNEYTSAGCLLKPLVDSYLLPYHQEDGTLIIPAEDKADDVDYPEDVVFGNIPESDIPEHCHPFNAGYGGPWSLAIRNGKASSLEDIPKHNKHVEKNEAVAFEVAYKMWVRHQKIKNS